MTNTTTEQIVIPQEAVQLLINALTQYPYNQVAPVLEKYRDLVQEANKKPGILQHAKP